MIMEPKVVNTGLSDQALAVTFPEPTLLSQFPLVLFHSLFPSGAYSEKGEGEMGD